MFQQIARLWENTRAAFGQTAAAAAAPVPAVSGVEPPAPSAVSDTEQRSYQLTDSRFWSYFGLTRGDSDFSQPVNSDMAFSLPPFFCAVRYICEGLSMLDRSVKYRDRNGVHDAFDHPVSLLVNGSPHPHYTWFDLLSSLIANACLGNGWLRIHRDMDTMRPKYLEHIPMMYVALEYDEMGDLLALISGVVSGKTVVERVPYHDMIHIKGLSLDAVLGMNVLHLHRDTVNVGLGRQSYSGSVLTKGARPSLAIKTDEALTEKEVALMEENFMRRHGGAENAGRPLVLDAGQDIRYMQWSPLEAALQQLAVLNIEDVSRITKVPRDFLALDTHGTYGAAAQRSQDFLTHCLFPWIEKIQDEFNSKLFYLQESRTREYYFEFDTSMFLALDRKSEAEVLVGLVQGSIMTPNEAREKLGLNPLPFGDSLFGNINTLPLDKLEEVALAKYLSSEGERLRGQGTNKNDSEDEPEGSAGNE